MAVAPKVVLRFVSHSSIVAANVTIADLLMARMYPYLLSVLSLADRLKAMKG